MSPHRSKSTFYCDENFPVHAGEFLKSRGYSVKYAYSKQKRGLTDVQQLTEATKCKSVLLTTDKDFESVNFPARRVRESCGIVIFHTDDPSPIQYQRIINKLIKELSRHQIEGKLVRASIDSIEVKSVNE